MTIGTIIGIIVGVLLIAAIIYGLTATAKGNIQDTDSNQSILPESNSNESRAHSIDIKNFAYSPSTLTIKSGDTVTWTNSDTEGHTVASDSGNELESSLLLQNDTYTHIFETPGTYDYHCTSHPNMKASIIVN